MEIREAVLQPAEGRELTGYAVRYGDVAVVVEGDLFREVIRPGALVPTGNAKLNVQHRRDRLLAREGQGLSFTESAGGLSFRAVLPATREADDALLMVTEGLYRGVSVEMKVIEDRWSRTRPAGEPLRTVLAAELHGLALVDDPAYPKSSISRRELDEIMATRFYWY